VLTDLLLDCTQMLARHSKGIWGSLWFRGAVLLTLGFFAGLQIGLYSAHTAVVAPPAPAPITASRAAADPAPPSIPTTKGLCVLNLLLLCSCLVLKRGRVVFQSQLQLLLLPGLSPTHVSPIRA
jgi:hypothetical protein